MNEDDLRITEEQVARLFGIPMDMVDGRPWVPREDELPGDEDAP